MPVTTFVKVGRVHLLDSVFQELGDCFKSPTRMSSQTLSEPHWATPPNYPPQTGCTQVPPESTTPEMNIKNIDQLSGPSHIAHQQPYTGKSYMMKPLGNPDFGDCATGSVGAENYHLMTRGYYKLLSMRCPGKTSILCRSESGYLAFRPKCPRPSPGFLHVVLNGFLKYRAT
ncbi:hypothetical protein Bbelb_317280 [Branchiostoma belcheri]|nr:hypothetical protein Bbelb_317280 [Branchiostoma belcheri]